MYPYRYTLLFLPWLLLPQGRGVAHEVDQYDIPAEGQYVDLGDYWDTMLFEADPVRVCPECVEELEALYRALLSE